MAVHMHDSQRVKEKRPEICMSDNLEDPDRLKVVCAAVSMDGWMDGRMEAGGGGSGWRK